VLIFGFEADSLQMTPVINPAVGRHYFLSYPQLPSQLQSSINFGWYQFILLGEQRHSCEWLAWGHCMAVEWPQIEPISW